MRERADSLKAPAGRAGGRAAHAGQRGQALVELAITTVMLMILLAGILDLSRAFHYTIGLTGAVRAGARHATFFNSPTNQQPYLDNADIKLAVDQVLAGDGLSASTLKASANCLTPTDGNTWANPPYANAAYPTAVNSPWLYVCYDTQGSKTGTNTSPPAVGDLSWTGKDVAVILLSRYGLIGGLSTEYLKQGAALTSIQLTSYQHFAVQG
jgi:Flp pilus assembly protein TadG